MRLRDIHHTNANCEVRRQDMSTTRSCRRYSRHPTLCARAALGTSFRGSPLTYPSSDESRTGQSRQCKCRWRCRQTGRLRGSRTSHGSSLDSQPVSSMIPRDTRYWKHDICRAQYWQDKFGWGGPVDQFLVETRSLQAAANAQAALYSSGLRDSLCQDFG